jgi:hypothetical protein
MLAARELMMSMDWRNQTFGRLSFLGLASGRSGAFG